MRISNKLLGIFALIGAPWLFLGGILEEEYPQLKETWFTGLWGLLYISGFICSVIGLQRMHATGAGRFGKGILWVLMACLVLANISNIIQLFVERNKPAYFFYIDIFWPLSNVILLFTGITVIIVKGLDGWKRYLPLAMGLWLPMALASQQLGNTAISFVVGGLYSAVAWSMLAIVVMSSKELPGQQVQDFSSSQHQVQVS